MVAQPPQFELPLEGDHDGSVGRTKALSPELLDRIAKARQRVNGTLNREATDVPTGPIAREKSFFDKVKDAASGTVGWTTEKGVELRSAWREFDQARKAHRKGELTKVHVEEATEAILELLGAHGALSAMNWPLSKLVSWYLEARDHELHKTAPDYSNLAAQFMDMHPDDDDQNSYHHAVESLFAGMDERALRRTHYNAFSSVQKFRHYYGTPDGRKKIKEQMAKLLGPEVDEPHELTEAIENIAERSHIEITGAAPSAVFHAHDLQHRHANHCLHALAGILQVVYNEVTPARLTKIMGPNEDVKLEDDLAKFGENLRKKVRGNADVAAQLLGKIETAEFLPFFHTLRDDTNLENSMDDEPELVKEQIRQIFNFSAKENISDADLRAVRDEMVGTRTSTPPPAGAPAGTPATVTFSGGRFGTPPADAAELAKFNVICGNIYDISQRLLAERTGAAAGSPSRLRLLYPERAEDIKFEEFGAQLGRSVRSKSGSALGRSRDAFLRGWDRQAFQDHFEGLRDATEIQNALDTKAGKEAVKKLVMELTGLKVPTVSTGQWTNRLDRMMGNIACDTSGVPVAPTTPPNPEAPTLTTSQANLGADLNTIKNVVNTVGLDAIFAEENLERNLGSTLNNTANTGLVDVFNKIQPTLLSVNYGLLAGTPPAVMPVGTPAEIARLRASAPHTNYQRQLCAFLGVPRNYTSWSPVIMDGLLTNLGRKAVIARTRNGGTHTGADDLFAFMSAFGTWNPTAPGTFTSNPGRFPAAFFGWMNALA